MPRKTFTHKGDDLTIDEPPAGGRTPSEPYVLDVTVTGSNPWVTIAVPKTSSEKEKGRE